MAANPQSKRNFPAVVPKDSSVRSWGFPTSQVATDKSIGNAFRSFTSGQFNKENRKKSIPKKELANLASQLAIMTRTGVDVASALESLSRQTKIPAARDILVEIHGDVMGGMSLSTALGRHPQVFDSTFIATISAGEASGKMAEVLTQLSHLLRGELKLQNSVRQMLAYPVLLFSVSGLVTAGLIFFVLPTFARIFEQYETPLPWITSFLLAISNEFKVRFWIWIPLGVAAVVGTVLYRLSPGGRLFFDRVALNWFPFRDVTRPLLVGRVCRLMGLMLDNGVPLLESLRLARTSIRNVVYASLFDELEDNVLNGRGLSQALLESDFIPTSAAEMVSTAERTGSIGTVCLMLGQHYEDEGESRLKDIISCLEPMITIGMGLVVAGVVLAVTLPMFDIATLSNQ